jgi:isopenicillin-N epimerase
LDKSITFLNHGAFGACPLPVRARQRHYQDLLERQPLSFLVHDLEPLLDRSRAKLAQFIHAPVDDLVYVSNATAGVNAVLRSLTFKRGDELLTTSHVYNACRNVLIYVAEKTGARIVIAEIPFPVASNEEMIAPIMAKVTGRTRIALLDHVTSPTGIILPVAELVKKLSALGVDTLVDGAHAPGMIPLDVTAIGATYYTGNCHKWLCAPKSAGFLYVQRDRQALIRPPVISHGASTRRTDRSRFQIEFAWQGTSDPSAALAVPDAIKFIGSLLPGGWKSVMKRNHALAVAARQMLCETLNLPVPCPPELIGTLATIPLPPLPAGVTPKPPIFLDPLQETLLNRYKIEVPIMPWPGFPNRALRLAAQLYNSLPQYEKLAAILAKRLPPRP